MRIAARNWRRPEGELDIVATDLDGTCVFCEVRSRTGELSGDPLETVNTRKQRQIIRCARSYLAATPTEATAFRFDVIAVTFFGDGRAPRVTHLPGAFETTT